MRLVNEMNELKCTVSQLIARLDTIESEMIKIMSEKVRSDTVPPVLGHKFKMRNGGIVVIYGRQFNCKLNGILQPKIEFPYDDSGNKRYSEDGMCEGCHHEFDLIEDLGEAAPKPWYPDDSGEWVESTTLPDVPDWVPMKILSKFSRDNKNYTEAIFSRGVWCSSCGIMNMVAYCIVRY